jgi:hypothetical protein
VRGQPENALLEDGQGGVKEVGLLHVRGDAVAAACRSTRHTNNEGLSMVAMTTTRKTSRADVAHNGPDHLENERNDDIGVLRQQAVALGRVCAGARVSDKPK